MTSAAGSSWTGGKAHPRHPWTIYFPSPRRRRAAQLRPRLSPAPPRLAAQRLGEAAPEHLPAAPWASPEQRRPGAKMAYYKFCFGKQSSAQTIVGASRGEVAPLKAAARAPRGSWGAKGGNGRNLSPKVCPQPSPRKPGLGGQAERFGGRGVLTSCASPT